MAKRRLFAIYGTKTPMTRQCRTCEISGRSVGGGANS